MAKPKSPGKRGRPPLGLSTTEGDWNELPSHLQVQAGKETLSPAQAKFLRHRMLTGLRAWRCCSNRLWWSGVVLERAADAIQKGFDILHGNQKPQPNESGAFFAYYAPAVKGIASQLLFRMLAKETVIRIAPVVAGFILGELSVAIPETQPQVEAVTKTLRAISTQQRRTVQQGCYDCIVRLMSGQKKKRKSGVWRDAQKNENRLSLRMGHK